MISDELAEGELIYYNKLNNKGHSSLDRSLRWLYTNTHADVNRTEERIGKHSPRAAAGAIG